MTSSILVTKLFIPPTRQELVSRPLLIERLNEGFHRKLTLISAPAGFGKTTLVTEWLDNVRLDAKKENQIENKIAWLSLDEGDNDQARFLSYFIAALNQLEGVNATFGKEALSMLQSPQPPPTEAVLTPLINDIANIPGRIILVLDDYHLVDAQSIHDTLSFLLEHLPPQMHLVIVTREDPHLPLSRLRASNQMADLRAEDLRFTSPEAAKFLNQVMGLNLSADDITSLESRTEGWIAGLQLAAISLQGKEDTTKLVKSFSGSHRLVLDYLIEEVLEQQSESIQTFLLQTAILERLSGSLCDAVRFGIGETPNSSKGTVITEQDNSQVILEMLEHTNLFIIPLDEKRHWYRYHHLFADLLRQRLRQTQPDWILALHTRASEWYEQTGFADEAIEHALRAEDFDRASYLIEEQADAIWGRGEHTKLRRWLEGLPADLVFSKPQLCIFQAWGLFAGGQQEAAERCLQAAEQALDPSIDRATETSPIERDQPSGFDRMKIKGRAATIRAFLTAHRGNVPGIIQHARQALEHLPEQDFTWRSIASMALADAHLYKGDLVEVYRVRLEALELSKASGNVYSIMTVSYRVAISLREKGQLQQVLEICQQRLQLANERGISQMVVVGWILGIWGEVLAEMNELDGAIDKARKGVELSERGGDVATLSWSYLCLIRVLFSRGDMTGAEQIIQKMANITREYVVPTLMTCRMAAWQARVWLVQDKLDDASQWVLERGLDAAKEPTYVGGFEYIALARILIAQEQLDEATGLLQQLLEPAEKGGHTSRVIEIMILQALTCQAQGSTDQAITTLEKALTLAEPEGFIRIFVDEGPPMARLLYETATRGMASDYVSRLLSAFPMVDSMQSDPSKTQTPKSELVEPLSDREIEVLQLIAEGLTNQEVASRLFLASSTVKVHTRNIYGKLGVNNRTQAIARARALGILHPT